MEGLINQKLKCPFIKINLEKLEANARVIREICNSNGIKLTAVTKCFCADEKIIQAFIKAKIDSFADSRIKNLKKLQGYNVEKMLIRIPMISEAEEVVRYSDVSMNSSWETVKYLGEEAIKQEKAHKVILMLDIGDLREGVLPKDALEVARKIINTKGIRLIGIGANYGCFGGVMPDCHNLNILISMAREIEERFHVKLELISGGNSFTYTNLAEGTLPKEVNHFRFGDIILTGTDGRRNILLRNTYDDAITLGGEVIEVKDKPSKPYGPIEKNAFGEIPYFEDRGMRRRAILAVGRQDIKFEDLVPIKEGIEVLGASSDHLILDIEECKEVIEVGDVLEFKLHYGAMLAAFTSQYIYKYYILC